MISNSLVPNKFDSISMEEDRGVVSSQTKIPHLTSRSTWINLRKSKYLKGSSKQIGSLRNRDRITNDLEDELEVVGHVQLLCAPHKRSKGEGRNEGPLPVLKDEKGVEPTRLQMRHVEVVLAPVGGTQRRKGTPGVWPPSF